MEALSSPSSRVSMDPYQLRTASAWRSRFRLMLLHDGHQHIDQAIDFYLKSRSFPSDSEVLLLSVSDLFRAPLHLAGKEPVAAPGAAGRVFSLPKYKKAQAFFDKLGSVQRQTREKLQAAFPGWDIRFDRPLVWHPDVIFLAAFDLSARSHSGYAEIIRKLSSEASVPLIIARQAERRSRSRFSAVVFDGPASANALLKALAQRPADRGGELYLMFYQDPMLSPAERWSAGYEEPDQSRVDTQLVKTRKAIEALGHKVSCVNVVGNTAQAILQEAKRVEAESILLGTAPLTAAGSLGLQSVAAAVAAQAECPVEIVFSRQKLQPTATLKAVAPPANRTPWENGGEARISMTAPA